MKIYWLHGEDNLKVRERLDRLLSLAKKRSLSVSEINGTWPELTEALLSGRLFGEEGLYLARNVARVSPKEWKVLFTRIKNLEGTLVVVYDGLTPAKALSALPKEVNIETFKLPKAIFSFLDSFYPGNTKRVLQSLHSLVVKEPPEYILALLGRHLRDLYWAGLKPSSLPYKEDWRILKLANQTRKFPKGKLKQLIAVVAKLDITLKTSSDSFEGLLDQLILTHLE